ncbi:MAG: glycosyltransferase family 2 protein [Nitrospirota bacterium]|nr:glycosyltransferase family 2 protein [Nitrospirota bacterium]
MKLLRDRPMPPKFVTVVIPCYQHGHVPGEAIESVLAQTHPYYDVIVVDDGSPDHTAEVASRYPGVRYLRQDNRGVSAAHNAGLRRSRGTYVVFLDANDRLLPHHFEAA